MKSCQTRIPSSSQRSWNAVALVGGRCRGSRSMFMPARRATARARARARRAERRRAPRSSGVQTAPRANTGTPLTRSCEPVALELLAADPQRRGSRPARASTAMLAPSTPISSVTSCSAGSPWVCGHQRATSGTPSSPCDARPVGRPQRQRRLRVARSADSSTATALAAAPRPAAAGSRAPTARRRAASRARSRSVLDGQPPPALEPHRPPRADRRPARARTRARGRAASCGRSAGCPVDDQPGAPARARPPAAASSGASARQQITSSFSAVAQLRRRRPRARANIESPAQHQLAVEVDLGDRRDPVEREHELLARRRPARPRSGVRNHQSRASKSGASPGRQRAAPRAARRRPCPERCAGEPLQAVEARPGSAHCARRGHAASCQPCRRRALARPGNGSACAPSISASQRRDRPLPAVASAAEQRLGVERAAGGRAGTTAPCSRRRSRAAPPPAPAASSPSSHCDVRARRARTPAPTIRTVANA